MMKRHRSIGKHWLSQMGQPRRRRSHRRTRSVAAGTSLLIVAAVAIITTIAAVIALGPAWSGRDSSSSSRAALDGPVTDAPQVEGLELGLPARQVYRYSVVPGGVQSVEEVTDAVRRDAVVADHYKNISLAAIRLESVTAPRAAHMSYRVGDRIYWTKRKVRLHPGETILSDGATQIRARCGNCIADRPLGPTLDREPDPIEFDRFVVGGPEALVGRTTQMIGLLAGGLTSSDSSAAVGFAPLFSGGPSGSTPGFFPGQPFPMPVPGLLSQETDADPAPSDDSLSPGLNPLPAPFPPSSGGPPPPPGPPLPPRNPPETPRPPNPPVPPDDPRPPITPPEPPGPPPDPPIPPVPEPGTILLVGTGLAGLALRKLRSNR